MSIFKALLTLLSLLLTSLIGYILFKNNLYQEEKPSNVIHIEQMTLPAATKSEDERTILSNLKQYMDNNKQYKKSVKTNEDKILKELKKYASTNISQDEIVKSIQHETSLIKNDIKVLSAKIDKKIENEVKILKKDINKNTNKINKKIALTNQRMISKINKKIVAVNKNTLEKIKKSISKRNENYIISDAYELKNSDKILGYHKIETIAASPIYKIDEEEPIQAPIDISTETIDENLEELNVVQTLGVVKVSKPYVSTDDVM